MHFETLHGMNIMEQNGTIVKQEEDTTKTFAQSTKKIDAKFEKVCFSNVEPTPDFTPPRQKWSGHLDFILTCVSCSVGLGNIWRFPYICYKNGGGAFLIPYFLCVIFVGIPMLFLELSLGQYLSQGAISVWRITPFFEGVGYASVMNMFWSNIYYIIVGVWTLSYLFHSFTTTLPWSTCDNPWNTPNCMSNYLNRTNSSLCFDSGVKSNSSLNFSTLNVSYNSLDSADCFNISKMTTPIQEFWDIEVLQISKGINEPGSMNWPLAGYLLLAWIMCYLCVFKGVKWLGKVSWLTSIAPLVLLFILLIRGITLPGASDGILYYIKPDFSKLHDLQVWNDALTQILFSYAVGIGAQIALGSYNEYHNNIMRDSLVISAINSSTSIFSGFVIFSVLGFMAKQQGKLVENVVDSGPGLVFLIYPSAIAQMPLGPVWAIFFFLCLFVVGFSAQVCGVEAFITALLDYWPQKLRNRRALVALLSCILFFLVGLSMVNQAGIYVFELFNHFSASGISLGVVIFFECIAISYGYGVDRYMEALKHMLGFSPGRWWKWCLLVVTPLACLIKSTWEMIYYENLSYQNHVYPFWSIVVGWLIMLTTLFFIPAFALKSLIKTPGSFRHRIKQVFRPYIADEPRHAGRQINIITSL